MKVLLIGECYSSNVGDQIVASITKTLLCRLYPSFSIFLMDISGRQKQISTHNKQSLSFLHRLCTILLKKIPILDAIRKLEGKNKRRIYYQSIIGSDNYNLAVFCGGQVINSTFIEQMDEIAKQLFQANIPTIYSSVGLGIVKEDDIKRFKQILEYPNVKTVSCRCDEKRFNSTFNFDKKKVQGTFDPGVCASNYYGISRKEDTACVGLGIMSSSRISKERIMTFWMQVVSSLEEKNIRWKMFYTGTRKDYVLSKEILTSLHISNQECKINEDIHSPIDLLNELSQFSKIISFRLHSHILSYSMGIPTIAISWDQKIDDFFAKIRHSDRVFNIESEVSSIINKLEDCEYISNNSIQESMCFYTELFAKQCDKALLNK